MTERLKLGFDIDGVIANFHLHFTRLASDLFHLPIYPSPRFVPDYDFGYSREQMQGVWSVIGQDPDWWLGIPVLAGEDELKAIAGLGESHDVVFITARPGGTRVCWATEEWLRAAMPDGAQWQLSLCGNMDSKKKMLAEGDVFQHVDDHPDLVGLPNVTILAYPYNWSGVWPDNRFAADLSHYLASLAICIATNDSDLVLA